jgi:hypothetical protein
MRSFAIFFQVHIINLHVCISVSIRDSMWHYTADVEWPDRALFQSFPPYPGRYELKAPTYFSRPSVLHSRIRQPPPREQADFIRLEQLEPLLTVEAVSERRDRWDIATSPVMKSTAPGFGLHSAFRSVMVSPAMMSRPVGDRSAASKGRR